MDYPYADCIYITVLVPEEEYITQTGNESAMYAAIDAKKGEDKQIKEYIDKNILKENDMINVFSVLDMKESFQRYVSKYYMIGSFLVYECQLESEPLKHRSSSDPDGRSRHSYQEYMI